MVPGTHPGAPANYVFRRMFLRTTLWGTGIWAIIAAGIIWSGITVQDLDFFGRIANIPRQ